jgi:hypothetical protein
MSLPACVSVSCFEMHSDVSELVRQYVSLHNAGVRTGDFAPLVALFAPDGEIVFEFGSLGVLRGRMEIERAFRINPPIDELILGLQRAAGASLSFEYAWHSSPGVCSGTITFILTEKKQIARLTISP